MTLWKHSDPTPYQRNVLFLELKELAGKIKNRGFAYGEKKIHEFPPFPIATLNENEYRALDILMTRGQVDSIKELIEYIRHMTMMKK